MRLSTPSGWRVGGLGLALMALSCTPAEHDRDASTDVTVAALANDGCFGVRPPGLPAEVDELVVQISTLEGWTVIDRIAATGPVRLLTGIDSGETLLRFIACVDRAPQLAARPAESVIDESGKGGLTLHFKPLGRLACTGTTQGPAYNRYAGLGRARAFAATAPLPDGRVVVVGGADAVDDNDPDRFIVRDSTIGWDVYTPASSLFLPGVDRDQPLLPRPTLAPRIAALGLPWQAPGAAEPGALIIGGVPALRRAFSPFGPLKPDGPAVSRPGAEYFDPSTGALAPVDFVDGAVLADRFMPAGAVDDTGRIVIAGGVEWPDETASDLIEIIDGDILRALTLPVAEERANGDPRLARNGLIGATVTHIGDGRFVIWAGDLNGCGQRPGWLLTLDPTPRIEELAIAHPEPAPTCGAAQGCRTWYSTAYHTATSLGGSDDLARILIVGGVGVGPQGLTNNPDPGEPCGPNAFVLEVDPAALSATVNPVAADFEAAGALKRAFHTATAAGGERVLIAGGWAFLGNANLLANTDDVLFYRDARPAGRIEVSPDRLTAPRMGGLAAPLANGGVLLGGGLSRAVDDPTFTMTEAAEVYTAPIDTPVCEEGG